MSHIFSAAFESKSFQMICVNCHSGPAGGLQVICGQWGTSIMKIGWRKWWGGCGGWMGHRGQGMQLAPTSLFQVHTLRRLDWDGSWHCHHDRLKKLCRSRLRCWFFFPQFDEEFIFQLPGCSFKWLTIVEMSCLGQGNQLPLGKTETRHVELWNRKGWLQNQHTYTHKNKERLRIIQWEYDSQMEMLGK